MLIGVSLLFTACGGGGGGGGNSSGGGVPVVPSATPTSSPTPSANATFPPPSSRSADVLTIATGSNATQIAYWNDNNAVVLGYENAVVNAASGVVVATTGDSNNVLSVAYSAPAHSVLFATSTTIYSKGATGPVLTVAINLHNIESMTVGSDGTVYAVDTDHIIKISGGVPSNVTAPGTIGQCAGYEQCPSLAFDSADGALLVSDPWNDVILHVTTSGSISTYAGSCKAGAGFTGTGGNCWPVSIPGTGAAANFDAPAGLAYDTNSGVLYVADQQAAQLWAVSASGAAAPVAGYGYPQNVDGNGLAAFLNGPSSLAFQPGSNSVDILEGTSNGQEIAAFSLSGSPPLPYTAPAVATYFPQSMVMGELAAGPDGSAWMAESTGHHIDHITAPATVAQIAIPSNIVPSWRAAIDAHGNAWFLAQRWSGMFVQDSGLFEIAASGTQTYIAATPQHQGSTGTQMQSITIGPDGNPWFTESETGLYGGSFGFVNASTLAMTQFATPSVPGAIAPGSSTSLAYFGSASGASAMQFVSLTGQLLKSSPLTAFGDIDMKYRASDGTDWFVDGNANVVSLTSGGVETHYQVCGQCAPVNVTIAPDGSVWSDQGNGHAIDRVTASGQIVPYLLPTAQATTYGISARSDGKLWVFDGFGVLYLFDPAAYDAMGGLHSIPSAIAARAVPLHHWSR